MLEGLAELSLLGKLTLEIASLLLKSRFNREDIVSMDLLLSVKIGLVELLHPMVFLFNSLGDRRHHAILVLTKHIDSLLQLGIGAVDLSSVFGLEVKDLLPVRLFVGDSTGPFSLKLCL